MNPVVNPVKYLVCRSGDVFEVRPIYEGESWEETWDYAEKKLCTIFRRDGHVVDSAGELFGEFSDYESAKIHSVKLHSVLKVMES